MKELKEDEIHSIQVNDSYSFNFNAIVQCPDCKQPMETDQWQNSWNETKTLCVITLACPKCKCSGSIHLNLVDIKESIA